MRCGTSGYGRYIAWRVVTTVVAVCREKACVNGCEELQLTVRVVADACCRDGLQEGHIEADGLNMSPLDVPEVGKGYMSYF
eukprot:CAMPEP_0197198216 /NCGR_PEP_ID=MMETSP1423-20130617/33261_1 /TAXON_ID=476441 /ORGANISM="Pseudo-nitzschia heimii, Strain UNC1101" /LENGTH=80 /DNA_ID=CAMNT_0042652047 /DNA_START=624 /DNA_END=866 /DNA_ORIENTATION=+